MINVFIRTCAVPNLDSLTNKDADNREEQDQAIVARVLSNFRAKDDNRNARRTDQNQARRRIVRSHRDNSSASSSTSGNSLQYQHWRLLDLLMDSALDVSTQKQKSFVSLLPPPPPRATSKILPPTAHSENHPSLYPSNSPLPIQVRPNSQVTPLATLEENQKDEEEWLRMKQDIIKKSTEKEGSSCPNSNNILYGAKSSIYKPLFPQLDTSKLKTAEINGNRYFRSLNPSPITPTPSRAKSMYTGGFNPQRIAPAVQIRSVIPVCAAPPSPMRTPSSSLMQEASPSTISFSRAITTPTSTQTRAPATVTEVSPANSILFNKTNSTEF